MNAAQARLSLSVARAPGGADDVRGADVADLLADAGFDEGERGECWWTLCLWIGEGDGEGGERGEPAREGGCRWFLLLLLLLSILCAIVAIARGLCGGGGGGTRCGCAAAVRVARDDDVLDAELCDCVGEDGEDVIVVWVDLAVWGCLVDVNAARSQEERQGRQTTKRRAHTGEGGDEASVMEEMEGKKRDKRRDERGQGLTLRCCG